jgi:quinol monooxygenase YgiN
VALVVVTRYLVPPDQESSFPARARQALDVLRTRPGCRRGHVGRAMDDPARWILQTEWDSVGSYRRALSTYEVKVGAVPLMCQAIDEPTAYEVLLAGDPAGLSTSVSDRAPGASTDGPGRGAGAVT